jgi:thiol-disulfide isomerase/thioredoxin
MDTTIRSASALALAILVASCAGTTPNHQASGTVAPSIQPAPSSDSSQIVATPFATAEVPADELLALTFTDVRSGEAFTLAELAVDGPVLLQPMAVWCTNCRAQQHEVVRAHGLASFLSVSLDIDLSESPDDLAAYADREGFDWRFAMADAELYRLLQERFGVAVTNPPSTPLIVVEIDGTVRPLEFGRGTRSAEQLLDELGLG